ncbi:MAG: hypothetical protein RL196_1512 [Actinomycetota bacterium]|jgi:dTDP-4-dehydrorhamnose reductase
MLGQEFAKTLQSQEIDVATFNRSNFSTYSTSEAMALALENSDVVINCIAYTAVDKAESEEALAYEINAEFPRKLAIASAKVGAKLIHFSTDYVFDGSQAEPHRTGEAKAPKNAYGRTKAAGEDFVLQNADQFAILRTAWLYGQYGKCFPKTIANALTTRDFVEVVNDQHGQPTWTKDVVDLTLAFIESGSTQKIIHAVSQGEATWFNFAQAVATSINKEKSLVVRPVTSENFVTAAKRPKFSLLETANDFDFQIGHWLERWRRAAAEVLS